MKNILFLSLAAFFMLLCGCANFAGGSSLDGTKGMERAYKQDLSYRGSSGEEDARYVKNFDDGVKNLEERAEALARQAEGVEGVEKAAVVITGNTAVVGIKLAGEPDDSGIIAVKKDVEKAVKNFDGRIRHVAVSAAAEMFDRILDLSGSGNNKTNGEIRSSGQNRNTPRSRRGMTQLAPAL